MYETEGIELQQRHLGNLIGVFTTDIGALSTYTSIWGYASYAEREERRASSAGRRAVARLPRPGSSRCSTPSRTAS